MSISMPKNSVHTFLPFISLVVVSLAAGCDPGAELDGDPGSDPGLEEQSAEALMQTGRDVPVENGVVRKMKVTCGRKCVKMGYRNAKPRPIWACVQYAVSCDPGVAPSGVVLHANDATRAADQPFAADYFGGEGYDYQGCGRSAALNVLGYLGVPAAMSDVAAHVKVSKFGRVWKDELGSYDNWVRDGLQSLLNERAPGRFTVQVHNWTDVMGTVIRELNAGNPAIILVNGGGHWVTAVGYAGGDVLTIDYPWAGIEKKPFYALGTDFFDGGDLSGIHGWKANTVITIRRN